MKRILFLMTFVLPLLFSCSKEEMQVKDERKTGQVYTIYASFDDGETKTTLGPGNKPLWVAKDDAQGIEGDRIWLSNGEVPSFGTVVSVDENNVAKIETSLDLSGKTIYAVYPYTADEDCSVENGSIRFKIPSTQDGTFAKANICAAKSTDGKLHFKNVTSLFKVSAKAAAVKKFEFAKAGIAGEFEAVFDNDDGTPTVSVVSGKGTNTITVTDPTSDSDGMYFIAVSPNLSYGGGDVMGEFYNGSSVYCTKKAKAGGISTARSKILNLGVTNIDNALNGTFTVNSSGKKVMFSKGNLYHDNGGFKFETNQTDVATSWTSNHVSHFFHYSYANNYGMSMNSSFIKDSYDTDSYSYVSGNIGKGPLFTNKDTDTANSEFTVNGQKGIWRTLSDSEFGYLLNERTVNGDKGIGHSYAFASIDGVNGVIIFKDDYTGDYTGATTDLTDIPSGCVFLPFAGYRDGEQEGEYEGMISRNEILAGATSGYYWCNNINQSSWYSEYAYFVQFKSNTARIIDDGIHEDDNRFAGMCIRLVADF